MVENCSKDDLAVLASQVESNARLVEKELSWRDRAFDTYKKVNEESLLAAKENLDRRLIELNELRQQVIEDRTHFLRTDVYESKHDVLANQANNLDKRLSNLESSLTTKEKTQDKSWSNITIIITLAIATLALLINAFRLLKAGT